MPNANRGLSLRVAGVIFALIFAATFPAVAQNNLTPGQTAADHAALSNTDIAEMVKAGLSEDVVLAKIRTCGCHFDTSTAALSHLKASGVPDSIVVAMIEVSSVATEAAPNAEPNSSGSGSSHAAVNDAPVPDRAAGVLFVAQRTSAHLKYSSREVFQAIVDDLLLFLKSNRVPLANDAAAQPWLTEDAVSVYSLASVAKNVGASHLLFVVVDRPTSKWVKVSVTCYEPDGRLLWQEKSQAGGGVTSKGQIEKALKQLEKQMLARINASQLPVETAQQPFCRLDSPEFRAHQHDLGGVPHPCVLCKSV